MKKKLQILLLISIVLVHSANAKTRSGIYMSFMDYKNNHLSYESDAPGGKAKIHVHTFFWNQPTITVVSNGEKHTYRKNELYGFNDGKNVYRFYQNYEYQLAEAGNIYIYTQQNNIAQSKGYTVVNTYYFSTTPDGAIMRLTLSNLKAAYSNNEKFMDLLDLYFSNGSVSTYDTQHQTFKVNSVFQKTISK